jgi:hypothetical protein
VPSVMPWLWELRGLVPGRCSRICQTCGRWYSFLICLEPVPAELVSVQDPSIPELPPSWSTCQLSALSRLMTRASWIRSTRFSACITRRTVFAGALSRIIHLSVFTISEYQVSTRQTRRLEQCKHNNQSINQSIENPARLRQDTSGIAALNPLLIHIRFSCGILRLIVTCSIELRYYNNRERSSKVKNNKNSNINSCHSYTIGTTQKGTTHSFHHNLYPLDCEV